MPVDVPKDDAMMNDDEASVNDDGMMKDEGAMMSDGGMAQEEEGKMEGQGAMKKNESTVYTAFDDTVLANGETKVIYFHAAWCPKCKAHHERLSQWYPSEELAYSVYKIDYDTALELRSRYGVIQQHTFVLVDGQGNKISAVSYPDDTGLQAFLRG